MRRLWRRGFSLIELLIVVAIMAALVGVAVPFFQDNLKDAQQTKCKEDLDTIRSSLSLHDAQNRPLTGTSLKPLLGRYLQEIPKDPWGNEYMLDAAIGIVLSYGADAMSGGTGGDEDIMMRYKAPLRLQRTQYKGSWGRPPQGTECVIQMTKPYAWVGAAPAGLNAFLQDLTLLRTANAPGVTTGLGCRLKTGAGLPALDLCSFIPGTISNQTWSVVSTDDDAKNGIVILRQTATITANSQMWTATMAMNFTSGTLCINSGLYTDPSGATILTSYGIRERFYDNGPLDPRVYGSKAGKDFFMAPQYNDWVDGANRGVRLERF